MANRSVIYPFKIEGGSVATTIREEHSVRSKMLFLVGTEINERAMRPSWGINLLNTVHMVGGDIEEALPEAVENAVRAWLPKVMILETKVEADSQDPTKYYVDVRYAREGTSVDETLRTEMYLDEGTS